MPKPRFDPYAVLGVAPGASPDEIRDRYRILAHLLHPDRHQSAPRRVIEEAERHLRDVNEAYRLLAKGRHSRDPQATDNEAQLRQAREREAQLRRALERQAEERETQRRGVRRGRLIALAAVVIACAIGGFLLGTSRSEPSPATTSNPVGDATTMPSSASAAVPGTAARLAAGTYSVSRDIASDGTWLVTLSNIEVDERGRMRIEVVYRNVSDVPQPFECEQANRRNVYLSLRSGSTRYAQTVSCSPSPDQQLSAPGSSHTSWAEFGRISATDVPFSLSWYPTQWGTVDDIQL
jgi:DnaJ domain